MLPARARDPLSRFHPLNRRLGGRREARPLDALYRALFEHSIDCVLIATAEGEVVRANPAACRAFGLSEDALRRTERGERVVEDGPLRAFLARSEQAGEARGELRLRRADGSLFPAEVTASSILASDGKRYRCIIFRDVSDRRRAEERIREREQEARARAVQLEAVLDCIADGVIVYDRQGRTVRSSPAADEMLGLPASVRREPIAERAMAQYEIRTEDGRRLGPDEMVAVRAAVRGETVLGEIQQIRTLGGEPRWLLMSGIPLRISGEHVGAVVSLTDITERKRAEHALRQSEQSLREADRRKDEFLSMLSHELRNPLAPIRNSVQVLQQVEPRGERAVRARAVIERQAEHLTRLVDDLLDVTRIARGKIQLRREPVDLRELVLRVAEDFRATLDERGIGLQVAAPPGQTWVDADPTRVTQVIGNLLHNAGKYSRRDDQVTLSLEVAGGAAAVRVRDTGAGIDPALLPKVFDAFVQGERTLARTEGGLGLGLALVKGIVELHGGAVGADSAGSGHGSEFHFRLPLLECERARPLRVGRAPRPRARRRVLVVDDNADAADSLSELLRVAGHAVETVYDGFAALERASASPPEVVLCDIGLPGMSGYDVARALRRNAALASIRLVALSGYAQPEDRERAREAGFDVHLAKPPDLDALLDALG